MAAASHRLDVFDGLRGIAILLVVAYHAWLVSGVPLGPLGYVVEAGFLGVDLFFFISGFCLFLPYVRAAFDGRAAAGIGYFFTRRAQKIVPSYLLALTVFAIVYHNRFTSPGDAVVQLVSHLTFLHPLTPATFAAISGPLWTIGIEVQFYLLFPFIAPWFVRRPALAYGALVAVAETYRLVAGATGFGADFWLTNQLPAFLDLFGAGMLAAWLSTYLRRRAPAQTREAATAVALFAFAVALAGLAATAQAGRAGGADGMRDWVNVHRFAIGPTCIALGVGGSLAAERWQRLLAARPLVLLSAISYNVYLWHLEIMVWLQNAGLPPWLGMPLAIVTALGFATLVTYILERPILALEPTALGAAFARWRIIPARWAAAIGSPSSGTSSPSRRAA